MSYKGFYEEEYRGILKLTESKIDERHIITHCRAPFDIDYFIPESGALPKNEYIKEVASYDSEYSW